MEPTIFEEKPEQAILVALDTGEYDVEASLAELEELAHTAGAQVLGALVQKRESPDKATCLGSGRLEELTQLCRNVEADLVIFDPEEAWTVTEEELRSKSKNTPFLGQKLFGRVKYTICGGKVVYKD